MENGGKSGEKQLKGRRRTNLEQEAAVRVGPVRYGLAVRREEGSAGVVVRRPVLLVLGKGRRQVRGSGEGEKRR